VHDSGDGVPVLPRQDAQEPCEGGRGLLLVSKLADKWGVGERCPGKVVWCEFEGRGRRAGDGKTSKATGVLVGRSASWRCR
jgi:hypothetical protein